ncbi:lipocalin family protein [Roseovarius indicus]|uniref:Lipocalin-like domain protein n=1 Tax=Roseovarius indicus TaxID=540747 RepID=A0A5P3AJ18_9RHOB|nr:lipocalin family protein [Roseovarius indicus]QEW28245.1 Lipocalin-like domain protein [Roseovarius indicus]SFE14368.1 apolipoprotein D and lipocalin family protein [Roseovarius indicus]
MTPLAATRHARGPGRAGLPAAIALVLAGCGGPGTEDGLRDPEGRISSQTNVTGARLDGNWHIRVGWPGTPNLSGTLRIAQAGNGLTLTGSAPEGTVQANLAPLGNGRFRASGSPAFGDSALWVLWMDADDRTAAIGTPDGRFGWIMDRTATGGADRITAATEIMEWMGYDLSRSKETSQ